MIGMFVAAALAAESTLCDHLASDVQRQDQSVATIRQVIGSEGGLLASDIRLAPSPGISAADDTRLRALFPDTADVSVYDVSKQGVLWQISILEGTLNCQTDGFVQHEANGTLVKGPGPPAYADLCWTSNRRLGTVLGAPALIEQDEQDTPYEGTNVEITPWQAGWSPVCGLKLRYNDRFDLTERFCADEAICAAGAVLAPQLAMTAARGEGSIRLEALAPPSAETRAASKTAFTTASVGISDYGDDAALPTFKAKAQTEYPYYSYPTARVMIVLAGQPLLARVGVGGVGWRAIGDYLIALYRFADGQSKPVASFVVKRSVTGLRSVALYSPAPYLNNH